MHNGGDANYQRTYGGRAGATDLALPMLDAAIGLIPWWYTDPKDDPTGKTTMVISYSPGFYRNYSLHWFGGSGQSDGNNGAWADAMDPVGSGGLGIFTTQWDPTPDLSGLPSVGQFTWNHKQTIDCR